MATNFQGRSPTHSLYSMALQNPQAQYMLQGLGRAQLGIDSMIPFMPGFSMPMGINYPTRSLADLGKQSDAILEQIRNVTRESEELLKNRIDPADIWKERRAGMLEGLQSKKANIQASLEKKGRFGGVLNESGIEDIMGPDIKAFQDNPKLDWFSPEHHENLWWNNTLDRIKDPSDLQYVDERLLSPVGKSVRDTAVARSKIKAVESTKIPSKMTPSELYNLELNQLKSKLDMSSPEHYDLAKARFDRGVVRLNKRYNRGK